jgi:hypothetical protein
MNGFLTWDRQTAKAYGFNSYEPGHPRVSRCDCSECHRISTQTTFFVSKAARRVIKGGQLTGIEQMVLGGSSSEVRVWLAAEADAIYRKRSLFDFAAPSESNGLQNLEVRPLHNRKGEKA